MSTLVVETPRFGKDGRIISGRVRADGYVWCPGCRNFLPPSRFARSRTKKQAGFHVYCTPCHVRRDKLQKARNPDSYRKDAERKKRYRQRHYPERSAAELQEYQRLVHAALARLDAIGLRQIEIARLTGLGQRTIRYLGEPGRRNFRSSMELILGLFRVASDIEPGTNRQSRYAAHDHYDVLERRMVGIHAEIAQRRASGAYVRNLGHRVH